MGANWDIATMIRRQKLRNKFAAALTLAGKSIVNTIDLGDVVFAASVAAVCYGAAQVYQPAAWIIGGAIGIIAATRTPGGEK